MPHDEVHDAERRVRPDYAIGVNGAITGYVEVKAPGHTVDPATFRGHDLVQWERQRDLPNLIYTNGTEWRRWHDGEPVGEPVTLTGGPLESAGSKLAVGNGDFELLLRGFLQWRPAPITSIPALVKAIPPLTRLLKNEVLDQLALEREKIRGGAPERLQPFHGLATDWRRLLFPQAPDDDFADGYAQTVTFALLLARTEGIDLHETTLHEIGRRLGGEGHSLMGRALQLLTDVVAADFKVTLDLLVRLVGVVDWERIRERKLDNYLHLYEYFLEVYDPDARQRSGSYYTPHQVVEEMVRLTEDVLRTRLGKTKGFADQGVRTVDPAMGTGTYLHTIVERVAEQAREAASADGQGAVPGAQRYAVESLARQITGFEMQMGPYAVAELRLTDLLRKYGTQPPADGLPLFVTNTLDDPHAQVEQLGAGLGTISESRIQANLVKAHVPVTVVIGNPPYRERAKDDGGWIEKGDESGSKKSGKRPNELDRFRAPGNGLAEYVLKNLYIYFWRWATWKVFDAHGPESPGIVCFITTSGYLRGPGFKGMREYLRRNTSEGWIINVSPEGQRPDVPTRIFPGVQQPLAIGIFVRAVDNDTNTPSRIRYTTISGRRQDKYRALAALDLDGEGWRDARTGWQEGFTPAAEGAWDDWPSMDDLMPWTAPGVKPNRTWVYAPHPSILEARWQRLVNENDLETKRTLFKESESASLDLKKPPLPGTDTSSRTEPFARERGTLPTSARVGYRSFDRQWIIPDNRLIHRPSPPLWAARVPGQVFVIEQHSKIISTGPGLLFTSLIPDMDHFNNRGGRALPMLHPDGSGNLARGLAKGLSEVLDLDTRITVEDLVAYIAAVVAHPGFTTRFADELTTPGIRVPITLEPDLWREAVELGKQVVWLHTYGEVFADPDQGRPQGNVRYPAGDERQPLSLKPITAMPTTRTYDEDRQEGALGDGVWGPVRPEVWNYEVGGRPVVKSWFDYRKATPGGKKTSPLDEMHVDQWPTEWTREFVDLLTVLTRLTELEPAQDDLLDRILAGRLASRTYLGDIGTTWPAPKETPQGRKDRLPHYPASLDHFDSE
ncbi:MULTISPECIES: type ISP restriction/modification enzyme [Saccharothrix]|uniref:type ISP restriction/modification enzyme n=1 Tax=Saccharothrix TaxID=2071 RepID=UPI001300F649|nr:type ISP restriction/modification enzyme [Saccharothrix sp. CB00851]